MPSDRQPRPAAQAASTAGAATIPLAWIIAPLGVVVGLGILDKTGLDVGISNWFYDPSIHGFPLRDSFLLDAVMHHWAKYLVILLTSLAAAAFAFTYLVPELREQRRLLLFITLAMALAPLAVTALKQVTDRPCPWDLAEFGGAEPYTHLFESRGNNHARGLCFPAGHASTGFALLALFFAAHHRRRARLARIALMAGILAGLLLGGGRIVQGAHFLSHVLWSGVVCWLVMVLLYALLLRPGGASAADTAQAAVLRN